MKLRRDARKAGEIWVDSDNDSLQGHDLPSKFDWETDTEDQVDHEMQQEPEDEDIDMEDVQDETEPPGFLPMSSYLRDFVPGERRFADEDIYQGHLDEDCDADDEAPSSPRVRKSRKKTRDTIMTAGEDLPTGSSTAKSKPTGSGTKSKPAKTGTKSTYVSWNGFSLSDIDTLKQPADQSRSENPTSNNPSESFYTAEEEQHSVEEGKEGGFRRDFVGRVNHLMENESHDQDFERAEEMSLSDHSDNSEYTMRPGWFRSTPAPVSQANSPCSSVSTELDDESDTHRHPIGLAPIPTLNLQDHIGRAAAAMGLIASSQQAPPVAIPDGSTGAAHASIADPSSVWATSEDTSVCSTCEVSTESGETCRPGHDPDRYPCFPDNPLARSLVLEHRMLDNERSHDHHYQCDWNRMLMQEYRAARDPARTRNLRIIIWRAIAEEGIFGDAEASDALARRLRGEMDAYYDEEERILKETEEESMDWTYFAQQHQQELAREQMAATGRERGQRLVDFLPSLQPQARETEERWSFLGE